MTNSSHFINTLKNYCIVWVGWLAYEIIVSAQITPLGLGMVRFGVRGLKLRKGVVRLGLGLGL